MASVEPHVTHSSRSGSTVHPGYVRATLAAMATAAEEGAAATIPMLATKGRAVLAEEAGYTNVSRFTAAYRERIKTAGVRAKVVELRERFGQRTGTDG